MDQLFAGFDEAAYLQANPDVCQAVDSGFYASGLEHYLYHGFRKNRPGVLPEVSKAINDFMDLLCSGDLLLPPEHLRKRVHGGIDIVNFENIGRIIAMNIYSSINSVIKLGEHQRILDFGCGCGRIIRYLHNLFAKGRLYGVDIDSEAIAWCRRNLSQIGDFIVNNELGPLPFPDELFDFVYSISVFTHLPEHMELAWLEELRRVTKPGGYLLLTTHGEKIFQDTPEENQRQLREHGFSYYLVSKTEGLPDFYQTSFHTEDYIYRQWGKFFEVKKFVKNGVANRQDLILCRRPA